jgi:GNAT superfamily N-acetyltransferase
MERPGGIVVRVAGEADIQHAESIAEAIRREVEGGAIGMALRPPELLRARMLAGDAVIAVSLERSDAPWVGFCYVVPWEGGRLVATSALIVEPRRRGLGIARQLKEAALRLARARYPGATPFGLSTSAAVARINLDLGFREVPYAEITSDPEFWRGCESCPHHGTLVANGGARCLCAAFLLRSGRRASPRASRR